jgi:DNA polymerase-1
VDTHIYADRADLRAAIETGDIDAHLLSAAALFGLPLEQVTTAQRLWGKYLNMAAVLGLSEWGLADLCRAPAEQVREMLSRYRSLVLA